MRIDPDTCRDPDLLAAEVRRAARAVTDWRLEAEVHRKRAAAAVAEIARLRLTDAEREAIAAAADLLIGSKPGAILRKLLARLA